MIIALLCIIIGLALLSYGFAGLVAGRGLRHGIMMCTLIVFGLALCIHGCNRYSSTKEDPPAAARPARPPINNPVTFTVAGCLHELPMETFSRDGNLRRLISAWESAQGAAAKESAAQRLHSHIQGRYRRYCLGSPGS